MKEKRIWLNSISRERLNFRRRPILCTTLCRKRATSVAHSTNFSFEFFMQFSHKMPLYFFYTMVQKSKKWPKTQIKGSCLKLHTESSHGIRALTQSSPKLRNCLSKSLYFCLSSTKMAITQVIGKTFANGSFSCIPDNVRNSASQKAYFETNCVRALFAWGGSIYCFLEWLRIVKINMSFAVLLDVPTSVAEKERGNVMVLATDAVITAPTAGLEVCKNFAVIILREACMEEHIPGLLSEVKPRYAVEPAETKIWSFWGTAKVWLFPGGPSTL